MQQVSGSIQSQCTKLKAQRLPYFNANLGKNDRVVDTERLTANTPRTAQPLVCPLPKITNFNPQDYPDITHTQKQVHYLKLFLCLRPQLNLCQTSTSALRLTLSKLHDFKIHPT